MRCALIVLLEGSCVIATDSVPENGRRCSRFRDDPARAHTVPLPHGTDEPVSTRKNGA
jgi:hypothetical protein